MRRGALVTMYAGTHAAFRPLTGPPLARFAARHGYEVIEVIPYPEYHPAWSKLPALTAALANRDVVLWVDADVFVVDITADPADALSDETFMAILTDDRYGLCSALFAMRACPTTDRFLSQAWELRDRDYPDWDQGAIHELAGRDEYISGVVRLGHDWYGPEGSNPRGRIVHGCRQTGATVPDRVDGLRIRANRRLHAP